MKWLSIYIYYATPFELLLIKGVKPLIHQLVTRNHVQHYFFIRYWENGPHIRLRLLGEESVLRDKVLYQINDFLEIFFRQFPSVRNYSHPGWKSLNNAWEIVDYLPELERYGGKYGMVISERLFEASSRTVLQVIENQPKWSYENAIGVAIPLHLAFLNELNLDISQKISFLDYYVNQWIPSAYNQKPSPSGSFHVADVNAAFVQGLTSQKEMLRQFVLATYQDIRNKIDFEEEWMNDWISEVKFFYQQLQDVHRSEQISSPFLLQSENKELWSIYNSQMHMTNNRLGINNRDESFIAFILREILAESEFNVK